MNALVMKIYFKVAPVRHDNLPPIAPAKYSLAIVVSWASLFDGLLPGIRCLYA